MSARPASLLQCLTWAFVVLSLSAIILVAIFLPASPAEGAQSADWVTVAGAIDSYIHSQYASTDDGEAGFLISADQLKARIDPLGNNTFLGEGADVASAPVLVDTLSGWNGMIPDTSMAVTASNNAVLPANAGQLAALVKAHQDAGMSTDIITYCWTGHVSNRVAMAYGAMAQAGYFGSITPKVYVLKWGRMGWNHNVINWGGPSYPSSNGNRPYSITALTPALGALPGAVPGGCNATGAPAADGYTYPAGNAGLVECAGQYADMHVNAGLSAWSAASDTSYQPVDLRSTAGYYLGSGPGSGAGLPYAFQDTLNTLFDPTGGAYDNLAELSTVKQNIFYNRTQSSALLAATGAAMLGYNAGSIHFGLPTWDAASPPNWQEQFVVPSNAYPCLGTSPCSGAETTDNTAPTITVAPSVSGVTETSGTISWTTSESTTAKVQMGTSPGVYTITNNSTILHADHSGANARTITGLSPYTTYYYKVTSYDDNANSASSSEAHFRHLTQRRHQLPMFNPPAGQLPLRPP